MTERSAFLARVRDRLGDGRRVAVEVPDGWAVDVDAPAERFVAELDAVGGRAHRCSEHDAPSVLGGIVAPMRHPKVLVTSEPPVPRTAAKAVTDAGGTAIAWPDAGRAAAASADVGVTGAVWAVAETGTVVVSSTPPGGRAPSLLPPVHVAFVRADRLVATVADLFREIAALDPYPSNLVLITGPSKSSDIGQELARGVHGPGELHVVLIENASR